MSPPKYEKRWVLLENRDRLGLPFPPLSVSSGCCNRNTIDQVACKQQTFISHGSGGWKSRTKASADSVSGEHPLPGSQMTSFPCILMWQKGQGAPWGLFYKGTNLIHEGSTLMT